MNQPTKFKVSICTNYKVMKGDAKCRKWGGLGNTGVTRDPWKQHHSIQHM